VVNCEVKHTIDAHIRDFGVKRGLNWHDTWKAQFSLSPTSTVSAPQTGSRYKGRRARSCCHGAIRSLFWCRGRRRERVRVLTSIVVREGFRRDLCWVCANRTELTHKKGSCLVREELEEKKNALIIRLSLSRSLENCLRRFSISMENILPRTV
jgi:hypothetical protein